ncbi:hypothetical protein [Roseomonas indoligenes]|uniref:Uncharacterized protein n=1 Tax=Roseomonas indoligenes TaxID=2820811 RepID=A0A940MUC2_9PROT|nr:hypothetical protein [Pararoseomonas indoligenes]MBP0492126.1 hypothetical protein [Pararoseomonas indoligenes]
MGSDLREADLYARLNAAIAAAGSQEIWSRAAGLPPTYVSEVRGGKKPFSDRLLAALRVRRVVSFVELSPAGDAGDAERLLKALSPKDRRTLLWLPADGGQRSRLDAVAGEWRPLLENLKRLQAMRLAVKTAERWSATEDGLSLRAALAEKEGTDA